MLTQLITLAMHDLLSEHANILHCIFLYELSIYGLKFKIFFLNSDEILPSELEGAVQVYALHKLRKFCIRTLAPKFSDLTSVEQYGAKCRLVSKLLVDTLGSVFVHRCPDVFENSSFLSVPKKIRVHTGSVFENIPVNTKTLCRDV